MIQKKEENGERAMIEWKRLYVKPAGSLPGGVVTQWGVGAITVFVLLFLTYWIWLGGGEPAELPGATETATTTPRSFTDQMTARVDAETLRAETKRAAADRALRARQQQQANTAGVAAGQVTANEAALLASRTAPRPILTSCGWRWQTKSAGSAGRSRFNSSSSNTSPRS